MKKGLLGLLTGLFLFAFASNSQAYELSDRLLNSGNDSQASLSMAMANKAASSKVAFNCYITTEPLSLGSSSYPGQGDLFIINPFSLHGSFGVRFHSFYVGYSVGFNLSLLPDVPYHDYHLFTNIHPFTIDAKYFIPTGGSSLSPFVNLKLGVAISADFGSTGGWEFIRSDYPVTMGLNGSVIVGCEFGRFVLGTGIELHSAQTGKSFEQEGFYPLDATYHAATFVLQAGVRIGKTVK